MDFGFVVMATALNFKFNFRQIYKKNAHPNFYHFSPLNFTSFLNPKP